MEKVFMTSESNVIDYSKMLFTKILNRDDVEKVLSFLDEAFGKSFNIVFLDMPDCPALKEVIKFAVEKMMFTVYLKKFNEIKSGEFPEGTFLIIANPTPIGLMATMKALGLVYDKLDHDSAILNDPCSQRTINNLSRLGWKLHQVFLTATEKSSQTISEQFMNYMTGDSEAERFIELAIEEY